MKRSKKVWRTLVVVLGASLVAVADTGLLGTEAQRGAAAVMDLLGEVLAPPEE